MLIYYLQSKIVFVVKEMNPSWSSVFTNILQLKQTFSDSILLNISVAESTLEDTFLKIADNLSKLRQAANSEA